MITDDKMINLLSHSITSWKHYFHDSEMMRFFESLVILHALDYYYITYYSIYALDHYYYYQLLLLNNIIIKNKQFSFKKSLLMKSKRCNSANNIHFGHNEIHWAR